MKYNKLVALFIIIFSTSVSATPAFALDLTISGNGSDSDSTVNVSNTSNKQVSQTNNATLRNTVTENLNTGDNTASGNTSGNTAVTTGSVDSSTSISNSANTSSANVGCCTNGEASSPDSVTISGNGSDSRNVADLNINQNTRVTVNQNANITNTIRETAITGQNRANDNTSGNVSIQTGDISASDNIRNRDINSSRVTVARQLENGLSANITGNGSGSFNRIDASILNNDLIVVDNRIALANNIDETLITGRNTASDNTSGNVFISTGNITKTARIENGPINSSIVSLICCNDVLPPSGGGQQGNVPGGQAQAPTSAPIAAPSLVSQAPTQAGQVLAAAAEAIMPVTGGSWLIVLTIVAALMFILGIYLRLHPGQDPSRK